MLVEGGYFRAKLNTFLTEFDIVAGGLSWGIRNSRFAIDVEFVEEAAIRHKIKVAENICKALKTDMTCPHDLSPHQIQGLDFPAIAVVLAWLLKRVAAAREEHAYFVRQHTKLQFERRFNVPLFKNIKETVEPASLAAAVASCNTHIEPAPHYQLHRIHFNTVAAFGTAAAPQRVMVPADTRPQFASRAEHVASVLLEYGDRYVVTEDAAKDKDADDDVQEKRERAAQQEAEDRERAMLDRLASTMGAHHGKDKLSSAGLGTVLATTDQNKLSRLRAQYHARREELEAQLAAEEAERDRLGRRQARLAELEGEIATLRGKLKKARSQASKADASAAEVVESVDAEELLVVELERELAEAEAEARSDPERAAAIDALLSKRDEVKQLTAACDEQAHQRSDELAELKDETTAMQEEIAELKPVAAAAQSKLNG
jgi:hypothetical protein